MTASSIESVVESYESAQFGDQRLTKRFVTIIDRLSQKPHMSIPAAMNGRAEMEAAYRFFDNPHVTPDAILAPHIAATRERIRQTAVTLLVQDTTEIDVTRPNQQVEDAGPMCSEARRGAFYHPLFAFDAEGLPLGTAWKKCWTRDKIETTLSAAEKRKRLKKISIEDKESIRWIEGFRAARETAAACPNTQCVCIADSDADLYEQFIEAMNSDGCGELHLLVRASHDRALREQGHHLLDTVRATPSLYTNHVDVCSRQPKINIKKRERHVSREARTAEVEVRAAQVTFRPPRRPDRTLPAVTLNVVLVEEINVPAGQVPVQWILITTLPIDQIDQVQRIVHYYSLRWQIEVYFKTLKSGCRIESRYFEKLDRLLNCIAAYTIVAWKVFYLCRLSQQCPDLNCEVVFDASEWKPVYMAVRRTAPPSTPPSINEMTRMIASLGGYVIRKNTRPGTQTLWFGLQRLHDLSTAWIAFGPESRHP